MNPPLPDGSAEGGNMALVGWLLVGTGFFDILLALFFALANRPPDPRSRRILVIALAAGALLMIGTGAAFLSGVLPPR